MKREEIVGILEDKGSNEVKEFAADVARKLTPIYENDFGNKDLSFCMVVVACEAEPSRRAAVLYLNKLLGELSNYSKAAPHHFHALESMLSASLACIHNKQHDVLTSSVDAIEYAFAAAVNIPEIKFRLNKCVDRWKLDWKGYIGSP